MGLPALALSVAAIVQLGAEEAGPEAAGAGGVVGGELDQGEVGAGHRLVDTPRPLPSPVLVARREGLGLLAGLW